jgi:PH-interacting protein
MSRIHQLLGLGTSAFESGCAAPARPLVSDVVKKDYPSQFKNSWFGHASIVTCSRDGSAIIWTPRPRKYHVSHYC